MYPSLLPVGSIPGLDRLRDLAPDLAATAQKIYDAWDQDMDGIDAELGAGGICQDIASAMASTMSEAGFEHVLSVCASVGVNHVFLVALLPEGVFEIDIPPGRYESGAGYTWTKLPGIEFVSEDIVMDRLSGPIEEERFYADYSE